MGNGKANGMASAITLTLLFGTAIVRISTILSCVLAKRKLFKRLTCCVKGTLFNYSGPMTISGFISPAYILTRFRPTRRLWIVNMVMSITTVITFAIVLFNGLSYLPIRFTRTRLFTSQWAIRSSGIITITTPPVRMTPSALPPTPIRWVSIVSMSRPCTSMWILLTTSAIH